MKTLKFKSNYHDDEVALKDIEYIEVLNRKCHIYVRNLDEPFTTYSKLSELHSQLDKSFIKVNRSCIVSMNFIKSIADGMIKLNNNTEILPSQILLDELSRTFDDFVLSKCKISTPISFVKILFDDRNVPNNVVIKYKNGSSLRLEGILSFSI